MLGGKKRLIHRISGAAFLAAFLAFSVCSTATAANWADLVKDKLSLQHPRTLRGKAFLDVPLS
ncbi:MAG: hypothetical protein LJE96_16485, partial [Deltaproteobacteria bacterium]|nr:hypothetical protein [Deltaproteobacteria bacterium]